MENVVELVSLNRQTLFVIQNYAKENTVFNTATKFGLPLEDVREIAEMSPMAIEKRADDLAKKEQLVTCKTSQTAPAINARTVSIDAYFKSNRRMSEV
jgi:hypothetical protein